MSDFQADVDDNELVSHLDNIGAAIRKSKKGRVLAIDLTASREPIDDHVVARIAVGLPRIKNLNLSGTSISDRSITQLSKLRNLETLEIEGVAISDQVADLFVGFEKLALLNVTNTNMTREKVAELRKKMIGTRIIFLT